MWSLYCVPVCGHMGGYKYEEWERTPRRDGPSKQRRTRSTTSTWVYQYGCGPMGVLPRDVRMATATRRVPFCEEGHGAVG